MAQRSSHYDWFKGNNQGSKKTPKENAKTVWKFTRIFLLSFLFFTSMWGCVQALVLPTNRTVGKGVELYSENDKISPSINTIRFDKATVGTTDIYTLDNVTDNVYIDKKGDIDTLTSISDELKKQGVNTLDEAYKGGNVAVRFTTKNMPLKNLTNHKNIATLGGVPLVWSTSSTKSGTYTSTPISDDDIKNLSWWKNVSNDKATKTISEDTSIAAVKPSDVKTTLDNDKSRSKWAFNKAIFKAITDQIGIKKINLDPKTLTGLTVDQANKIVISHNKLVSYLQTNILGLKHDTKANVWKFTNAAAGYSYGKYRPIASWGDAWTRGFGPFYGIFVYPISWVTNKIVDSFPIMNGWESLITIFLIVIMISALMLMFTWKGLFQQTKTQELQAKKAVIDAKYETYKGNKQMEARKKQEVADLYKREGISPLGSISTVFVTMPFFLAMWRVIGGIQHIKGTTWLGINFAATSYKELFAGHFNYLWLLALTLVSQGASQLYPRWLTGRRNKTRINVHQKEAMKKANKTQNIMMIVMVFMSMIWPAGLQVYLLFRSMWTVIQTTIIHHMIIGKKKRNIRKAKA